MSRLLCLKTELNCRLLGHEGKQGNGRSVLLFKADDWDSLCSSRQEHSFLLLNIKKNVKNLFENS